MIIASMLLSAVLLCEGCRQLGKWRGRHLGIPDEWYC